MGSIWGEQFKRRLREGYELGNSRDWQVVYVRGDYQSWQTCEGDLRMPKWFEDVNSESEVSCSGSQSQWLAKS